MDGQVKLPLLKKPPTVLEELLNPLRSQHSKKFKTQIRSYNAMFAMTSMGGKIDHRINDGRGPYIFRLNGQNHHRIGTLLPADGVNPSFAQLYFYDTDNEVPNRINALNHSDSNIDPIIVDALIRMLDETNSLVKTFQIARDRFRGGNIQHLRLRLIGSRSTNGRVQNLPTCSEIVTIIIGDIDTLRMHIMMLLSITKKVDYKGSMSYIHHICHCNILFYFHMGMMVLGLIFYVEGLMEMDITQTNMLQ
jgi:hypothetical protein